MSAKTCLLLLVAVGLLGLLHGLQRKPLVCPHYFFRCLDANYYEVGKVCIERHMGVQVCREAVNPMAACQKFYPTAWQVAGTKIKCRLRYG